MGGSWRGSAHNSEPLTFGSGPRGGAERGRAGWGRAGRSVPLRTGLRPAGSARLDGLLLRAAPQHTGGRARARRRRWLAGRSARRESRQRDGSARAGGRRRQQGPALSPARPPGARRLPPPAARCCFQACAVRAGENSLGENRARRYKYRSFPLPPRSPCYYTALSLLLAPRINRREESKTVRATAMLFSLMAQGTAQPLWEEQAPAEAEGPAGSGIWGLAPLQPASTHRVPLCTAQRYSSRTPNPRGCNPHRPVSSTAYSPLPQTNAELHKSLGSEWVS